MNNSKNKNCEIKLLDSELNEIAGGAILENFKMLIDRQEPGRIMLKYGMPKLPGKLIPGADEEEPVIDIKVNPGDNPEEIEKKISDLRKKLEGN